MKKFLSLALVLLMVLSFAAVAGAEGEARTIEFWHTAGGDIGNALQANVDAFNESQSEIFCKATFQGDYDSALIKIKAAVPAGEGPDVFQMFEMATAYLADVDWVIPFQEMLDQDPFMDIEDLNPMLRNYYTVDGQFLCLYGSSGCRSIRLPRSCTTTRPLLMRLASPRSRPRSLRSKPLPSS